MKGNEIDRNLGNLAVSNGRLAGPATARERALMPFTISHVAAVLPFSRWLRPRQLLSAAVIGSMVPDFGIFFPWHLLRSDTHGVLALVGFILPVGLASYWIFQYVIKPAFIEVLPDHSYQLASPFAASANIRSLQSWLLASGGILLGAMTHLAWDAFTHEGARGMRMIPALDELMLVVGGHHLAGQRLLQDVSSLVGFAIIGWWIAWALRRETEPVTGSRRLGPTERAMWLLLYGLAAVVATVVGVFVMHDAEGGRLGLGAAANDTAVSGLRGLGVSLLAVSLALILRLRFR
jgi:hypothetical protein